MILPVNRLSDVIFLSFDEPQKEVYWENLKRIVPWAKRVDGIKGFDAAHKACAQTASTNRFFIIDGDNLVLPQFLKVVKVPLSYHFSASVYSWAARNSVNGLIYGNGGIKNWSRKTLLNLKSHEAAESPEMATDFCFGIQYIHQAQSLSEAHINQTPFQSFRAGFREGVKMTLINGIRFPLDSPPSVDEWLDKIARSNLERLKIWCSVGADIENGYWAIYGARLGIQYMRDPNWNHDLVSDYLWLEELWANQVMPQFVGFEEHCFLSNYSWSLVKLKTAIEDLGHDLNKYLKMGISLLNESQSDFFKSVYINRPRQRTLHGTQSRIFN